jgi:hypothetical protein
MVAGPLGKILSPLGVALVLVGVATAALAFVFILLDLTGDFPTRVRLLTAATALPLVVGGAALAWLAK